MLYILQSLTFLLGLSSNFAFVMDNSDGDEYVSNAVNVDYEDFETAVLMSTGLMPENKTFMRNFYQTIFGPMTFGSYALPCECQGCSKNDICLPDCVTEMLCEHINGFFCH